MSLLANAFIANIYFHALSRAEVRRGLKTSSLWPLTAYNPQKKEWQAFQSVDSELGCVYRDFTKYGKALLRSGSQSRRIEMRLLLCRSSGLCCTSSWGVVWFLFRGPLEIDMGQTSVSSLSQRASGKCLKRGFFSLFAQPSHRYILINAHEGKTDVT